MTAAENRDVALPRVADSRMLGASSFVAISIAVAAILGLFLNQYGLQVGVFIVVFALIAQGLSLTWGHGGFLSLCHTALFALGAYAAAIGLTRFEVSHFTAIALSVAVPMTCAAILGILGLRRVGHAFAILTLVTLLSLDTVANQWNSLTGGPSGLPGVPLPRFELFGTSVVDLSSSRSIYFFGIAILLVLMLGTLRLLGSRFGRTVHAVRDNPATAESLGVPVWRVRVILMTISAIGPGLAGYLFAVFTSFAAPDLFSIDYLLKILVIVVAGGIRSTPGILIGSVIVIGVPELLRFNPSNQALLYAICVLIIMRIAPQGVLPAVQAAAGHLQRAFSARNGRHDDTRADSPKSAGEGSGSKRLLETEGRA